MQLDDKKANAREVSAWPCETGYKTGNDRIVAAGEDDRDLGGRIFRSECCEILRRLLQSHQPFGQRGLQPELVAGRRSPSAQRYSIVTFCPST
jgi:hypothetical protein